MGRSVSIARMLAAGGLAALSSVSAASESVSSRAATVDSQQTTRVPCQVSGAIGCPSVVLVDTSDDSNTMSVYPACSAAERLGPEEVYELTLLTGGPWTVSAAIEDGPTVDLDVFILASPCDSDHCLAGGNLLATVSGVASGATLYVSVDTFGLVAGPGTLTVMCESELLFGDDFEAGDLCRWSFAQPSQPCSALGAACGSDADCSSGLCLEEASWGFPAGMCVRDCSTASCDPGTECVDLGDWVCLPACASHADCRAGYSCFDQVASATVCYPDCEASGECPVTGTCNPWLGLCAADRGAGRDGAACTTAIDCESYLCFSEVDTGLPGSYCSSVCGLPGGSCPGDGVCVDLWSSTLQGRCLDGCSTSANCRSSEGYTCQPFLGGNACWY